MKPSSVTLADVAQVVGVSSVTVSNVIHGRGGVSEATRKRVLEAIKKTGYMPNLSARSLAGGKTQTLGMIVSNLGSQYTGEIVRGVSHAAAEAGFDLLIHTTSAAVSRERERISLLSRGLADGFLALLPKTGTTAALSRTDAPVVIIDHRGAETSLPTIAVDNYAGARAAMTHLIQLGHQRIGFVAGRADVHAGMERYRGYREGLLSEGLSYDDALVQAGYFRQRGGFAAATELLQLAEPPTAIFAANDLSAFGVLDAAKVLGIAVPREVSVIGFDDIPMSTQVHPALTTVQQPLHEMGQAAVRALLALLKGIDPVTGRVQLPTKLIVRETTAAPHRR